MKLNIKDHQVTEVETQPQNVLSDKQAQLLASFTALSYHLTSLSSSGSIYDTVWIALENITVAEVGNVTH